MPSAVVQCILYSLCPSNLTTCPRVEKCEFVKKSHHFDKSMLFDDWERQDSPGDDFHSDGNSPDLSVLQGHRGLHARLSGEAATTRGHALSQDASPLIELRRFADYRMEINPDNGIQSKIVAVAVASDVLVIATDLGTILRIDMAGEEEQEDLVLPMLSANSGVDMCRKIFLDPSGRHCIVSTESKSNYYFCTGIGGSRSSKKLQLVPFSKQKSIGIECVGWNRFQYSAESTGRILLGLSDGSICDACFESGKERSSKNIWKTPLISDQHSYFPIIGIHIESIPNSMNDSSSKAMWQIIVATPQTHYRFRGGPSFENVFSNSDTMETRKEFPGDLQHGNLHILRMSNKPRILGHLTGSGVYIANLDSNDKKSIIQDKIIPFLGIVSAKTEPLFICVTSFHLLILFPERMFAINLISEGIVFEKSMNVRTYGNLIGFAYDEINQMTWLYSDSSIFEISINDEERDIWRLLLEKEQFDLALKFSNSRQKEVVIYTYANHLFKIGNFEHAAEIYAKSSHSFEEIALKFIQRGAIDGLRHYLMFKLKDYQVHDQERKTYLTQRTMIATWLVEIYLDRINSIKDTVSKQSQLNELRDQFYRFLQEHKRDLHPETTYQLIASHGLTDELVKYAEIIGDFERIISHHIQQNDFNSALKAVDLLVEQVDEKFAQELVYKFVAELMYHEPKGTVDILSKVRFVDPAKILPALMRYDLSYNKPGDSTNHAIRYLEYCIDRRGNLDPGIHNYLISLYAKEASEEPILKFIRSQEDFGVYDLKYALRLCHQEKKLHSCVYLYNYMHLYSEAVKLALTIDFELAKEIAVDVPSDYIDQKKLWLLIGEYIVEKEKDIHKAIEILREYSSFLNIEDILPLFQEDVRIGDFKDEISRSLSDYTVKIEELKKEMNNYTSTADKIRRDIQKLRHRYGEIPANRACDICAKPILLNHFLLFPCHHAFHSACAEQVAREHLKLYPKRIEYFADSIFESSSPTRGGTLGLQAAQTGDALERNDPVALSKSECVFCGDLIIESTQIPLIRYDDELEDSELESWKI